MITTTAIRKTLTGIVVSDKMAQTVVVLVKRYVKHPKYGKFISRSKRYKAHDPEGRFHTGETVSIRSCRPLSRDKYFEVLYR